MDLLTWNEQAAREKHDKLAKEHLERANQRLLERECNRAGVDLNHGISPALLNMLRNK